MLTDPRPTVTVATPSETGEQMTYTANIQQAYRSATAHDQAQGLQWYGEAARIARALAVDSSLTPEQTAGVIAALSPMNGWRVNLMLAERLILTHRAGT